MIRVVLVDDHPIVRDSLCLLLESEAEVKVAGVAGDGREAVRQVLRLHPDVVLMDIAMPELNGIDAARQIREEQPSTAIVLFSMYSSPEFVSRALKAGVRGYVLKQSACAEVIAAIHAVHRGEHYFSAKIAKAAVAGRAVRQPAASPLDMLTHRECGILQLTAEGKSSAQSAQILSLSPKSVETYRSRIMCKLGVKGLPQLVKFAIRHGLISLE